VVDVTGMEVYLILGFDIVMILCSNYGQVLDWWSDLLDSSIQCVTTPTPHTLTHAHTLVSTVTSSLVIAQ
jgi:hypothetical protein